MPYHYLGSTGLKVSALGLGTMTFVLDPLPEDVPLPTAARPEAFQILDEFAKAGGNFIDTADMYTENQAEQVRT